MQTWTMALIGWSALERIHAIACPVLILAAEFDYTPLAEKRVEAARFQNPEFVVIEGSRHGTPFDATEEFNARVVQFLTERYGFDAVFNYKDGDVRGQLAAAAPEGIDVYFDNVGGEHLEAAVDAFKDGGRAALCGAISQYNETGTTAGPRNIGNLITRGLTLQRFTVGHYTQHFPAFSADMAGWLTAGDVVFDETVVDGIENAVAAFLGLMRGENTGKMVVRVAA